MCVCVSVRAFTGQRVVNQSSLMQISGWKVWGGGALCYCDTHLWVSDQRPVGREERGEEIRIFVQLKPGTHSRLDATNNASQVVFAA